MSTQLTIDLKAVAYCRFFWKNDKGNTRRIKPRKPTVFGVEVGDELAIPRPGQPQETMLQEATRLYVLLREEGERQRALAYGTLT